MLIVDVRFNLTQITCSHCGFALWAHLSNSGMGRKCRQCGAEWKQVMLITCTGIAFAGAEGEEPHRTWEERVAFIEKLAGKKVENIRV